MGRKYSLAYLTIPGTDPVEQIRIAKETGYDSVSLRTIPMHLPGEVRVKNVRGAERTELCQNPARMPQTRFERE